MSSRRGGGRRLLDDHPLSLRAARSVEVEDFSAALAVAEYESIRAESLQSFSTSQSIIQWSMATYGVLFGAGLLAANSEIAKSFQPMVEWMAVVIYGLLLPGLVCAAAWSWIGEIRRMERAGAYLRGVERRTRLETKLNASSSVIGPLNWETFLATGSRRGSPVKGWAPYIGTSLLFGGGLGASVVFFYIWVDRLVDAGGVGERLWTLIIVNALLAGAFVGVCIHMGYGVISLGRQYYEFSKEVLEWTSGRGRRVLGEVLAYLTVVVVCVALAVLFLPESVAPWKS